MNFLFSHIVFFIFVPTYVETMIIYNKLNS